MQSVSPEIVFKEPLERPFERAVRSVKRIRDVSTAAIFLKTGGDFTQSFSTAAALGDERTGRQLVDLQEPLRVEDNPGDIRLTRKALEKVRLASHNG